MSYLITTKAWSNNELKAFPFDPNPDWSRFYSSGAEIEAYIVRTAKKWNLDRDVKLNHEVKEARWLEDRGQWRLTVEHAGTESHVYADVLLSGQGVLVCVSASIPRRTSANKFDKTP